MDTTPTPALVTEPAPLSGLTAELAASPAIGLDTEFMRERTYRAQLCLVQASNGAQAACIDPLALPSLEPLMPLLAPGGPLKVLHAARQDLEVLTESIGPVGPVFDTQVAAALAGFPAQVGYAELARRLIGVELAKAHTRTDWSRRPLKAEQIDYALDDVRYLLPLREALIERLDGLGRLGWLDEELARLVDPRSYVVEPDEAWRRLKGLAGLDAGRHGLARALAAWRERRAIDRNRPRGWILDDTSLREIVLRVPRTTDELGALADLPAGIVRHCGDEILAIVGQAGLPDPLPPLPRRERPDPTFTLLVKRLGQIGQEVARELDLSPEVLATRRELERLAAGERELSLLGGWRREVLGERLLAAL